jgi:hypothetical protein
MPSLHSKLWIFRGSTVDSFRVTKSSLSPPHFFLEAFVENNAMHENDHHDQQEHKHSGYPLIHRLEQIDD